ncbi:lasso RiPP family leader peptide-containing protein [Thermostichus vulcanus]|uniref:Lasso RiPP family leader peptide-containing protein n=1 Tax=Thermostichus vulcanus str. 'Rupite' TaxID=2813851 RepID=A0ABT0CDW7_THEVL|nr:lasso RiPP family leader peptide-containing protein [Thermostichus vulcanus str. 'Rupite']
MKQEWGSPSFVKHGSFSELTQLFGNAGSDVLTGPGGVVVGDPGTGSIDACAQIEGKCI